ncbi:MAG: hypothetical protein JRC90_02270 [Deltaproteobacteria bacterium]|nr:hypothetical protein [Deltaproteobacteria bacterium]
MEKFEENIEKTGYVLEFNVSSLLKKHGWSVINNKYYIDDVQPAVREMDIVGYKARIVSGFTLYTVLIISCKKSEKNCWALISKDRDDKDPNIRWYPLHLWANDKGLNYILNLPEFQEEYLELINSKNIFPKIFTPSSHIFAFQEMNKKSGSVQNDKNIFSSVTSLMKAQGYEISSLSKRKRESCIYQFNLLSIVDTDLLEIFLNEKGPSAHPIDEAKYIGNYIINNQETCVKIHFITYSALDSVLDCYDTLNSCNLNFFKNHHKSFFEDILIDYEKKEVFIKEFIEDILWYINHELRRHDNSHKNLKDLYLGWDKEKKIALIELEIDQDAIDHLNSDARTKAVVGKSLKKFYRYTGELLFSEVDVPF